MPKKTPKSYYPSVLKNFAKLSPLTIPLFTRSFLSKTGTHGRPILERGSLRSRL